MISPILTLKNYKTYAVQCGEQDGIEGQTWRCKRTVGYAAGSGRCGVVCPPRRSPGGATDTAETAHGRTAAEHVVDGDHHLVIHDVDWRRRRAAVSVGRQAAAARAARPRRAGTVVDCLPRRRGRQGGATGRRAPTVQRRPGLQRRRRRRTRRRRHAPGSRHPVPRSVRVAAGRQFPLMMMMMLMLMMLLLMQPIVGRRRQIASLDAVLWRFHRLASPHSVVVVVVVVVTAGCRVRRRLLAAEQSEEIAKRRLDARRRRRRRCYLLVAAAVVSWLSRPSTVLVFVRMSLDGRRGSRRNRGRRRARRMALTLAGDRSRRQMQRDAHRLRFFEYLAPAHVSQFAVGQRPASVRNVSAVGRVDARHQRPEVRPVVNTHPGPLHFRLRPQVAVAVVVISDIVQHGDTTARQLVVVRIFVVESSSAAVNLVATFGRRRRSSRSLRTGTAAHLDLRRGRHVAQFGLTGPRRYAASLRLPLDGLGGRRQNNVLDAVMMWLLLPLVAAGAEFLGVFGVGAHNHIRYDDGHFRRPRRLG